MLPLASDDTIAAIASPPGGAARGIVRVSGAGVAGCLAPLFRAEESIDWVNSARARVVAGSLAWAEGAPPLPCDLYFWPNGRSYTGQPMAELHTFGCPPLVEAALRRVCVSGARLAEPGEFTLRAFLSGRLDLTQAEAVLAVVDAADPGQFDVALAQLAGGLAGPLHDLRERLLELLAHLEAGLDFPDEDLPFIDRDELTGTLAHAAETVATLARQMAERGETAERVRVVLVGWPNTGKSSLFNALAGRAEALVSEEPATTRDYLTAELELEGARCLVVDTAGVEPSPAAPEADLRHAAQASTREQAGRADLRVLCLDATRPLNAWERGQLASDDALRIVVLTKVDLPRRTDYAGRSIATSSVTGEGIERLRARLGEAVLTLGASGGDVVASTAVRCGESLRLAGAGLRRAVDLVEREAGEELVAVEVRLALESLGKTVGAVYTDHVLDRVFSRFCIGK